MENCSCMVSVTVKKRRKKKSISNYRHTTDTHHTTGATGGVYLCKYVTSHKISGPYSKSNHCFNFRSLYSHKIGVTNGRQLKIEGGVDCSGYCSYQVS